jgi:integrase
MPTPAYRMLFCTMFITGLRTSEACRLNVSNLDPELKVNRIVVRHAWTQAQAACLSELG